MFQVDVVPIDQELEQDLARAEKVEGREREQEVLHAKSPPETVHCVVILVVV